MIRGQGVPRGLWIKCGSCGAILYHKEATENLHVCPKCDHHFHMAAKLRLESLLDAGKFKALFGRVRSTDPLHFADSRPYTERIAVYQKRIGLHDAVLVGQGEISRIPVVVAAMEYGFMGGSMGSAVGEKITLAAERCVDRRLPLVVVSCSGGARMQEGILSLMQMAKVSGGARRQEGILSLMQMAKVSGALARMRERRLPFVSVLTNPTTGGVTASFAMLGDLNIAEPGALIGFAGPRVIEQTIRQTLPEGFQRSEFLLEHGMLDMVVHRHGLKTTLASCLGYFR